MEHIVKRLFFPALDLTYGKQDFLKNKKKKKKPNKTPHKKTNLKKQ